MQILFLALLLSACVVDPVATTRTDNPQVPVDTLFEKDGCTVYRFEDAGRYHYFVRCEPGDDAALGMQNCGKNCTHTEEIPTIDVELVK